MAKKDQAKRAAAKKAAKTTATAKKAPAKRITGKKASAEKKSAALKKGARITGADRAKLARELKKQYAKGKSIRELADSHGRSYGFVHRVLSESGVTVRGRGGATRRTSASKAAARKASEDRGPRRR